MCHMPVHGSPADMLDPICIQSGLAQKHWPEAGLMILAHRLASRPSLFSQNLTQSARIRSGFVQYNPGRLWRTQPRRKEENW